MAKEEHFFGAVLKTSGAMMRRLGFALIPLSMLAASPAMAQQVEDVQFARGSSGTTINGAITGRNFIDYRLRLQGNQTFSVSMVTRGGSPYFNVMEPGSTGEAIFIGSTSGNRFQVRTVRAGLYTIRVYQMPASERRGETARFTLNVSVGNATGAANDHPFHSRDALVAGTPYHATGPVRCAAEPGKPMSMCRAGVTRRATTATVHIDTPDGGERTILFRDGRAVSSDASAGLTVQRRGDTSIVRIGRSEVYEISDALVSGG